MATLASNSRAISTDVLSNEVESRTRVRPEPYQLRYWVKAGLLPAPTHIRPGQGHGRGIIALWEPECVDRLVFMMRARVRENLSVDRAARILVFKGYPLFQERLFKDTLKTCIIHVEEFAQGNRGFLKQKGLPETDKSHHLERSLKSRNRDIPEPHRSTVITYSAALLGVPLPDTSPLVGAFIQVGSLRALANAIDQIDLTSLVEAFGMAEQLAPLVQPLAWSLALATPSGSGIPLDSTPEEIYLDEDSGLGAWLGAGAKIGFMDVQRFFMLLTCIGMHVAAAQNPDAVSTIITSGPEALQALLANLPNDRADSRDEPIDTRGGNYEI